MGCISGKPSGRNTILKNINNEKVFDPSQVDEIINSIQQIIKQLERQYSKIISKYKQIPEKFAMLSPQEFLQQLRLSHFLNAQQIEEIEQNFLILFTDLSKAINQASAFIVYCSTNKNVNKEKKSILLSLVLLYENICVQFFTYLKENDSKRLAQEQINISHRIKRAFTRNTEELSLILSTQETQRQTDIS